MLESFVPLAFAAVFATDQNLADEAVLADLLTQAGFAADSLIAAGKSEAAKAAYDANLAAAMACGVFGAPSYVLEGEIFWGQDRLACLDEALAKEHQPYAANIS
ncbi:2-hydroxychromene-2-carboxylate isomerase [Methylovirgula sp. HY1]|nr:2-hydroxychromene-2-carboxylate isomerase [Methylovirgula sp. HY1]